MYFFKFTWISSGFFSTRRSKSSAKSGYVTKHSSKAPYTPVHGSRLNIAEIELSAMTAQCLGNRRILGLLTMNEELAAWHTQRNRKQKGVDWQFTTKDARIKLKRLYPIIM